MDYRRRVAPHAGAWIETEILDIVERKKKQSHPTRVRGLKQNIGQQEVLTKEVAPHAGAWIETMPARPAMTSNCVASHAGAWIETLLPHGLALLPVASHPTRVRGLKWGGSSAVASPHVMTLRCGYMT